jgi:hypothetical protein
MCGLCNAWVCVCMGFVMCGCFVNICTVFCIVSFMCIYSYLFRLY